MTPEQFAKLLEVLGKLSEKQHYTLTGAADWPILVIVAGGLISMLLASLLIMFNIFVSRLNEIKQSIDRDRGEWKQEMKEFKGAAEEDHDNLWEELRRCQAACCPRGKP